MHGRATRLPAGLANTNVRFRLQGQDASYVLRIHTRDLFVTLPAELPADWLPLSRLVDLVSQMTFLSESRDRPRVIGETIEVVRDTVRLLT
jgi:hypothetical protein